MIIFTLDYEIILHLALKSTASKLVIKCLKKCASGLNFKFYINIFRKHFVGLT